MTHTLRPILELIDEELALDGVTVRRRPIVAAERFVSGFVLEVRMSDGTTGKPGLPSDFVSQPWFQAVYAEVEEWYVERYGVRTRSGAKQAFRGVTFVASTSFEIHVPTSITRPGKPGASVWLSFPDRVLPEDNPLEWLVAAPNWESYSPDAIDNAVSTAAEVSELLRRISSRLVGTQLADQTARQLLAGIRIHLNSACSLILAEDYEGSFARAQWELQMACEVAFKGLLQQRTGSFPESHDLFHLHDRASLFAQAINREWIRSLPRWNEAANLRYGLGGHPSTTEIFDWYSATLRIIAGVCTGLQAYDLSRAEFEIGKAPWLGPPQPTRSIPE